MKRPCLVTRGRVPAQRLVEGPSRPAEGHEQGTRCAGRAAGHRRREAAWRATAVHAQRAEGREGATECRLGRRGAGRQRTSNSGVNMSVTRDVSQLSGWLKAHADCRGSQAGHTVRGELCRRRCRRRRAIAGRAHSMQRGEDATAALGVGAQAERAATADLGGRGAGSSARQNTHAHVRDAGGVPAQARWLKALRATAARVASTGHTVRAAGCGPQEAEEVAGERGARAACAGERARLSDCRLLGGAGRMWEQRTSNMCVHGRDAGRVPAAAAGRTCRRVLPRVASTGHTDGAGRAAGAAWEAELPPRVQFGRLSAGGSAR